MLKIVQRRKIWFTFSAILVSASIAALLIWGLKFGIDFTGGTLMEFSFKEKTLNSEEIKGALADLDLGEISVQLSGEKNVLLRFKDVDEDTHQKIIIALNSAISGENNIEENEIPVEDGNEINNEILEEEIIEDTDDASELFGFVKKALAADESEIINEENEPEIEVVTSSGEEVNINLGDLEMETIPEEDLDPEIIAGNVEENSYIEEKRFNSIGPVIGNELKKSAVWALIIALIAIVLYIGWAFRKVSRPISSFKYGIIATIALFHDVIITLGIFAVLGYFFNIEIGIPFVAALLTILGYSVNDTIVVFDRTRENLLRSGIDDFEEVVNKSVNETLIRSISTSFTTLLVLFSIFLFGGETIKYFVVALMIGVTAGTYSSIFIASPLLVSWQKWDLKRRK